VTSICRKRLATRVGAKKGGELRLAQGRPHGLGFRVTGGGRATRRVVAKRGVFISRRLDSTRQKVELWECEWENREGMQARKAFLRKIGEEQPLLSLEAMHETRLAICWSYGRTLDNIAVLSPAMRGHFSANAGADALLPCEFVNAGKYRNGVERWWCRTHQTHWGTKADQASYARERSMVCANHEQRMQYVVSPLEVDVRNHREVGIWCSLPPAFASKPIVPAPPGIRAILGAGTADESQVVHEVQAMSLVYSREANLFSNDEITRVNITPPAAFEFMRANELGHELSCVGCSHCSYPHLDLGDFARKPHRKHSCANCGRDSTWTRAPIVSTPLKPIYDQLVQHRGFEQSALALDLDDFDDCDFSVWPSTPAIVWTPNRAQKVGIRVRVTHDGETIVDDTFGEVVSAGRLLDRKQLFESMLARTKV
jgi:hypothetical protein